MVHIILIPTAYEFTSIMEVEIRRLRFNQTSFRIFAISSVDHFVVSFDKLMLLKAVNLVGCLI